MRPTDRWCLGIPVVLCRITTLTNVEHGSATRYVASREIDGETKEKSENATRGLVPPVPRGHPTQATMPREDGTSARQDCQDDDQARGARVIFEECWAQETGLDAGKVCNECGYTIRTSSQRPELGIAGERSIAGEHSIAGPVTGDQRPRSPLTTRAVLHTRR